MRSLSCGKTSDLNLKTSTEWERRKRRAERLRTSRWAALAIREESGREGESVCVEVRGGGRRDQTSRPELARGQAAAGFTLPWLRQPARLDNWTAVLSLSVCPRVLRLSGSGRVENWYRDRNVSIKSGPQRHIGAFYLLSVLDFPIIVKRQLLQYEHCC